MIRSIICCMILVFGCSPAPDLTASKTAGPAMQSGPTGDLATRRDHPAWLPDLSLTPGKVSSGWTLTETRAAGGTQGHRDVPDSLKKAVWTRYGMDKTVGSYEKHSSEYEIDHLIPNCL